MPFDGGFQIRFGRRRRWVPSTRQRFIRETSDFLTRALRGRHPHRLPRIPTRRVDLGGYRRLMRQRGARAAATHFWHRLAACARLD